MRHKPRSIPPVRHKTTTGALPKSAGFPGTGSVVPDSGPEITGKMLSKEEIEAFYELNALILNKMPESKTQRAIVNTLWCILGRPEVNKNGTIKRRRTNNNKSK